MRQSLELCLKTTVCGTALGGVAELERQAIGTGGVGTELVRRLTSLLGDVYMTGLTVRRRRRPLLRATRLLAAQRHGPPQRRGSGAWHILCRS